MRLTRRSVLGGMTGSVAAAAVIRSSAAQGKGQVVFAGYGGRLQDIWRETQFIPFEKATGIKVVDTTGISLAKVRAMVKTGNVEWDVFTSVPSEALVLAQEGMLEEIDYSRFSKDVIDGSPADTRFKHGIGSFWTSQCIAFNTRTYAPGGRPRPKNWRDVWDVANFPGKRMFPAGDYVVNPIEPALLADGVPRDKLYPLDLTRAYASLTKIRPHVVRWVRSSGAIPQAIVDGEADIGFMNGARAAELKDQGAPIDHIWDEGMINNAYMNIPKGAKNYDNALRFLDFIFSGPILAASTRGTITAGPVNNNALNFLSQAEKEKLNSYPPTFAKQVRLQQAWWAEVDGSGVSNLDRNAKMWNAWSTT